MGSTLPMYNFVIMASVRYHQKGKHNSHSYETKTLLCFSGFIKYDLGKQCSHLELIHMSHCAYV